MGAMSGRQQAKMWMLLKSEMAVGLKSLPWRMPKAAPSVPAKPSRPVAHAPAATVSQPPRHEKEHVPATTTVTRPLVPTHPVSMMKQTLNLDITSPFNEALLPAEQRKVLLDQLNDTQVKSCQKCRLCEKRTNTVFGEGSLTAKLLFIGEGPGEDEDLTGRPFVGRSGQLLGKMIVAMGLTREQVFIANVVKCRPPGNRAPQPDEIAACTPYLLQQIQTIRPQVIVTLGLPATQFMLQTTRPMKDMRGIWQTWRGIKLMPTYHPSYVLRSYTPNVRGAVWSDLQKVMVELGLPLKETGV